MAIALTILYALLAAPVRAGAMVRAGGGPMTGAAGVMIWGFRLQIRLEGGRNADGKPEIRFFFRGRRLYPVRNRRPRELPRLLSLPKRLGPARTLLRRGVRLRALEIAARIGGQDAARVALLTGLIRALSPAAPIVRVRCEPAFGGGSALRARCIADARLGTLLAACLLGGISLLRAGRKEETSWIIPSET